MLQRITIIDYGVGNIASLVNMFDHIGYETSVSGDPAEVAAAEKIVLPGIGAFDHAMATLAVNALIEPLRYAALTRRVPMLGVCLGMQLLARGSEEGQLAGLGLIAADIVKLEPAPAEAFKVPNIGWRDVIPTGPSLLFSGDQPERFYCVHSYHMRCDNAHDSIAKIDYGGAVTIAASHKNVHGVQFHPEKSHRFGMRLLQRFAEC